MQTSPPNMNISRWFCMMQEAEPLRNPDAVKNND
jgi:hypothetical protein